MGEIRRIERISYNSGRVERITRYTPEERAAKIKEIEQAAADRAEIRALLAKYPNPDHLSFAELLEQALYNKKLNINKLFKTYSYLVGTIILFILGIIFLCQGL